MTASLLPLWQNLSLGEYTRGQPDSWRGPGQIHAT